ncbi:ParA family protein [Ruegeria sp. B32]|uniref:ParA family protein n=1 Tax=Ruegeria sp. B32 TaxID=2867020 RepID=UPI0021A2D5C3|nr:ParA family protein [Ruegeria sp. B32]UWR07657.1 ParA family protein [Ruegeria sp. B32]
MAIRLAMFNHKGGTGKTVSAYNIGWKLTEHGHRVLLVDGDSQVNLTALALGFDRFDDYYDDPATKLNNIKDGVAPVFEGKPEALKAFDCPTAENNDSLFVLPGHADLAAYEGQLSLAQETGGSLSALKNLPGAIHSLIGLIEERHGIDFTIIDLNPGLGAINQNFFMGCDGFVVPTNPDPFSLMAVETLGTHLTKWFEWKTVNFGKFVDAGYPLRESTPVFLGTINARFNKHASKAAKKFDKRIQQIDESVAAGLVPKLASVGMVVSADCYQKAHDDWKGVLSEDNTGLYALGRVPDFQGLIHTATVSGVPIYRLNEDLLKADDIVGVVKDNALKNVKQFDEIFEAITSKIELLVSDDCREE